MTRPFFNRDRISDFEIFEKHANDAIGQLKVRLRQGYPVDFQVQTQPIWLAVFIHCARLGYDIPIYTGFRHGILVWERRLLPFCWTCLSSQFTTCHERRIPETPRQSVCTCVH